MVVKYQGYATSAEVESLSQMEAMVYLNRWLKSHNFYYDDKDKIYEIKDNFLLTCFRQEQLKITSVIVRESPVIEEMREAINNKGRDFTFLNEGDYELLEEHPNYQQYLLLIDFHQEDLKRYLPEEVQQQLESQYQKELQEYAQKLAIWEEEYSRYKELIKPYEKEVKSIEHQRKKWRTATYLQALKPFYEYLTQKESLSVQEVELKGVYQNWLNQGFSGRLKKKQSYQWNQILHKNKFPTIDQLYYLIVVNDIKQQGRWELLGEDHRQLLEGLASKRLGKVKQGQGNKLNISIGKILFPEPIAPVSEPKKPQYPQKRDIVETLLPDNYVMGSGKDQKLISRLVDLPLTLKDLDEAIAWAGDLTGRELIPSDITDDFVCCDVQWAMWDEVRDVQVDKALKIFEKVISGELGEPQEIYDQLTELDLNYECIGMDSWYDRRNHTTVHRDFGTWHEINFSQTGYWLVEFQSVELPEITFHLPIARFCEIFPQNLLDEVNKVTSDQEKFGRELTDEERQQYPLMKLLEILGYSRDDFSYQLKEYKRERPNYYSYYENNEDDEEDDDEIYFY